MSKASKFLNSVPKVTEAAEVSTFRCMYRGVEVSVLLLDRGDGAKAKRYSVASFATENGLNSQGGDGADWRLQGPAKTVKKALKLIDWSRFDVRSNDGQVFWSKLTVPPGDTVPSRMHQHVYRQEFEDPKRGAMVRAIDTEVGSSLAVLTSADWDEHYEPRPNNAVSS